MLTLTWPGPLHTRYYIFADGASGWSGCQHGALRNNYTACVNYLETNHREKIPHRRKQSDMVNDLAQRWLGELERESERVAKELGASYLRIDWFVDDTGLTINEISC